MSVWLVMKTEALNRRPFPVRKGRMVIGREPHADVRIPIPGIGARHAEITHDGDGVRVTDLGHDGGTFHNGSSVREAPLGHADELTIGPVTFEVHVGALSDEFARRARPSAASPPASPTIPGSVTEPKPVSPLNPLQGRRNGTTLGRTDRDGPSAAL